jgi:glutathione S-transferase
MAGEGDLKLLGLLVSPFVLRVRMALHMKGASYEYIEQDVLDKGELLLKYNPIHKKVPVLIHNGVPLCESQIIVQYIDEVWAGADGSSTTILPADPYDRATARFWAAYVDDKVPVHFLTHLSSAPGIQFVDRSEFMVSLLALQLFPAWLGILKATTEEGRAEKVKETVAVVEQLEVALAQCSNGKPFFAGDSVGFLDLVVGCNLIWFEALRRLFGVTFVVAGKTPLLAAWAERFGETEPAREVVPDADGAVEFAKKLMARLGAAPAVN